MVRTKEQLPPQDDVILFDMLKHEQELQQNIQWDICPQEHKAMIIALIKAFWDVFAKEGFIKQICGIQFHINTGDTKPICCTLPDYGPHET